MSQRAQNKTRMRRLQEWDPSLLEDDFLVQAQLGSEAALVRAPGKTHLSAVLLTNNPWEERDLSKKLTHIRRERERRQKVLDWNQRHFFITHVFDGDSNLRFSSVDDQQQMARSRMAGKFSAMAGCAARRLTASLDGPQCRLPNISTGGRGIFLKPLTSCNPSKPVQAAHNVLANMKEPTHSQPVVFPRVKSERNNMCQYVVPPNDVGGGGGVQAFNSRSHTYPSSFNKGKVTRVQNPNSELYNPTSDGNDKCHEIDTHSLSSLDGNFRLLNVDGELSVECPLPGDDRGDGQRLRGPPQSAMATQGKEVMAQPKGSEKRAPLGDGAGWLHGPQLAEHHATQRKNPSQAHQGHVRLQNPGLPTSLSRNNPIATANQQIQRQNPRTSQPKTRQSDRATATSAAHVAQTTAPGLCERQVLDRITQTLPVPLMIKANHKVTAVVAHRNSRLLRQCINVNDRDMFVDTRWAALQAVLTADNPAA